MILYKQNKFHNTRFNKNSIKIMEPSANMNIDCKDESDWILCSSRRTPGKFYYFNMRTGQSLWSPYEIETGSQPEENPTMSNMNFPTIRIVNDLQHIHSFGQAALTANEPKIIWMPIELPEVKKQTLDQMTQTSGPDRDIFVQACAIPLSQRFALLENKKVDSKPSLTLNTENGMRFQSQKRNWWSSKVLNSNKCKQTEKTSDSTMKRKSNDNEPVLRKPILKRRRTSSDTNCKK
ncbi:uncharacterized protein LOC126780528 [Nymphalis io]|uniref:uncharacterized protein LOC126780528 n=1 Tax=Inachis io TaxID=171585 RepID=UPI002168830A|nr:uncharacterized protein LOC126780528 [Nymphalis io]